VQHSDQCANSEAEESAARLIMNGWKWLQVEATATWRSLTPNSVRLLRSADMVSGGPGNNSGLSIAGVTGEELARMKDTKRCPKCRSADIILVPGERAEGGAGNLIRVSRWNPFAVVKPVLHVCGTCGYTENWLASSDDIARVKAIYGQ